MIRVVVNDIDLELGNLQMDFEFINPLFSAEIFDVGYSFDFKIPDTEHNRSTLKNSERLDARNINRELKAKIYFKGIFMFSGVITIKDTVNGDLDCYFNNDGLDLQKLMQDFILKDLEFAETTIWDPGDTPAVKQGKWGSHMIVELDKIINSIPGEITHLFPPIHAPFAYDNLDDADKQNEWWSNFVNWWWFEEGTYKVDMKVLNAIYANQPGWTTSVSPCPRFVYILKTVLDKFGFGLDETGLLADEEFQNLLIYTNEVLDEIETDGTDTYNVYAEKYALNDFLPDTPSLLLCKALKIMAGAVFYVQDNRVTIRSAKDLLSDEPEDWTKYAEELASIQINDYQNYRFGWTNFLDDDYFTLFPDQFDDVIIQNAQADETRDIIPGEFRPLASRSNARANAYGNLVGGVLYVTTTTGPEVNFPAERLACGFNTYVKSAVSDKSPDKRIKKLLLGVFRDVNFYPGNEFPMCFNLEEDDFGNPVGDRSIIWPGEKGLISEYLQDFLDYVNGGRPFTTNLFLPPHMVAELTKWRKIRKSFETEKGKITGIIKKFSFTLTMDGMSPVSTTFITKD